MATNPYYSAISNLVGQAGSGGAGGGMPGGGGPNLAGFQMSGQAPAPQYDAGKVGPGQFTQGSYGTGGVATGQPGSGGSQQQQQTMQGRNGEQLKGVQQPSGVTIWYDQNGQQYGAPTYGKIQGNYNFPDNPNPWAQTPQSVPDWTKIEDPYARQEWKIRSGYPTPLASHANTVGGFDPPGHQEMPYVMGPGGAPVPQQWMDEGRYGQASQGQAGGSGVPPGFNASPVSQTIPGYGPGGGVVPGTGGGGASFQSGPVGGFPQNMSGTPGLPQALQTLLGPLSPYVNAATSGLTAAYDQTLRNQMIDLQSRYAGEGSYLSSPMFAAQGQLGANLGAQYLQQLGNMQLGAAEGERGRQQQTALGLAEMYSEQAKQAMASGATLEAARLQYMADLYRTQSGTAADVYRTNAGMYGNELQYALGNAGLGVEQQRNLLSALTGMFGIEQQGQGQLLNAFTQLAQLAQQGDQNALNLLQQMYSMPGSNAMDLFKALSGISDVSKTTGPGLGFSAVSNFASGLGQGLGTLAAPGVGSFLGQAGQIFK